MACAPSAPRATITDSSQSSSTLCSRTQGTEPSRANASRASAASVTRIWPLPSYPNRLVFSSPGSPTWVKAAFSSSGFRTGLKFGRGKPVALEEGLFSNPILGGCYRWSGWTHDARFGQTLEGPGRHILKLRCHRGAELRQLGQALGVFVPGPDVLVGHGSRGALRIGIEHHNPVSHGPRPEGKHPSQLPSTQNPYRLAGKNHERSGSLMSRARRS